MTNPPHLVLYGHDENLHLTRRWLLERMGFHVSTATSLHQLKGLCQHRGPRLLVICYTVEPAECDLAIALAQAASFNLKIALLSSLVHRNPSHSLAQPHILVDNPAKFSKAIDQLIERAERAAKPSLLQ